MQSPPINPEEITSLSLDDIYQRLHQLDALEQSITRPPPARENSEDDSETSSLGEDDTNDNDEEDPIIQDLHRQRSALRNQAMVLSRPSLRPLTILHLPNDLLRIILDHFRHPARTQGRRYARVPQPREGKLCLDTIRNVRSVCRVLNELASPLLYPLLHVDLHQKSLDRAVHMSHCPQLASGVRTIRVGLYCFPEELASDLVRFRGFRLDMLQEIAEYFEWNLEALDFASDSDNEHRDKNKPSIEEQRRLYREATTAYFTLKSSWDSYSLEKADKANEPIQDDDIYQKILRSSYDEFAQKHRQQRQLLESQSFVRTLASCIARMPNVTTLEFADDDCAFVDSRDPAFLLDNTQISKLMTTGLTWQQVEDTSDLHLTPARILSELPIAIHNAGVRLHELNINIFPCKRDHVLVSPEPHDPMLWNKLRVACQSLRRASFGVHLNCLPIRVTHLGPNESLHINEYLSALFCSSQLETIQIWAYSFAINDGRGTTGQYDLSPVLATVKWPCIRSVSLGSGAVSQSALDGLCAGLGSSIKRFDMYNYELLEGSWAGALDVLREKVAPQGSGELRSCIGGEFGPRKKRERNEPWDYKIPDTPPIYHRVAEYISGADMDNPLRSQT